MKYLYLLAVLLLMAPNSKAQTWDWEWERAGGGTAAEELGGQSVSDLVGNTYVIGNFKSTTASFGVFTLPLTGTRNMFVARYNYLGNVIWARSSSACNDSRALAVAIDPMGSGVFVAGTYTGPSITFDTVTLTSATNGGMFIVKYDNSGNVVWAKNATETNSSSALSVAADVWGNCYVAGEYKGTSIGFGTATVNNFGLDTFDMFLVKYDNSGNAVWAKGAGGSGLDGANSISIGSSGAGDVYVTGYFSSPVATFSPLTLNNANSNMNTFIVKYDTSGNALWARKSIGNTGRNGNWVAAAIDPAEDVFVSGSFTGPTVQFDTATLSNANSNTLDVFLLQYDSSGNLKHAMRTGGDKDEIAGVTVDQNVGGRIFLTGYYSSDSLSIDTFTLHNYMTDGSTDIFSIGFNDQWQSFFAKTAGGPLNDHAPSCSVHGVGDMYIGGDFAGHYMFFGNDTAENHAINGSADIFVAKLSIPINGISNTEQSGAGISIYPNPAHDLLNIQVPLNIGEASVSLFSLSGQKINVPVNNTSRGMQMQLSGIAPGMYLLQVKHGSTLQYFKVMYRL